MAMVQSAPFGDLAALQDLDHNLLSPLSLHMSNPEPVVRRESEPNKRPAKRRQSSVSDRGKGSDGSKDQPRMLACLNCRQKKIKCYRENISCERCTRLRLQCIVPNEDERMRPSSKTHIRELESRIETLERQLKKAEELAQRNLYLIPPSTDEADEALEIMTDIDANGSMNSANLSSEIPPSLIARLCAKQSHFHTDEVGQFRFFGPTSSLHTTENHASSFVQWGENATKIEVPDQHDISPLLRDHLLEQYWKYQHTVLQVVHREAFLNDMKTGQCRYYSKGLLYSILASAAVFSEAPEIRALALSKDDDPGGAKPYLLRKATELVEDELENNAGITTVQGLQLLSAIHCRRADDTKGWMESGRGSRLIFELGLHKDDSEFQAYHLSPIDLEVRQVVFWGCFTYDRGWSLYLGRPYAINLDDITISRPACDKHTSNSWEMIILLAWTKVFDIVGHICNALNGKSFSHSRLQALSQQLLAWESNLDPSLQYSPGCPPSVAVLHMQFCSAMILLHRPSARFGTNTSKNSQISMDSKTTCLEYAVRISRVLDDYRKFHGHACTVIGTALYNITMAAVVLIANRAEQISNATFEHLDRLTSCIRALEEISISYVSARTILKQLKYLMRRCKLLDLTADAQALRDANASLFQRKASDMMDGESPPINLAGQILPTLSTFDETEQMDSGQFLMALEDCDALHTMGSWNDFDSIFT